jgi:hypothetical protein
MSRLRLIHWNAEEAASYLTLLRDAGHHVEYNPEFSPPLMREWRSSLPDVFVIDLSRLPSHGREIAIALRQSKATRQVPLIFCEGEEAKVAKTRELLPDATFCSLARLKSTIRKLRAVDKAAVVPKAMMDRYAGRTAAQKLGVREGDKVCAIDPPRDIEAVLGPVEFVESPTGAGVTLLFATDPQEMQRQISELRVVAARTKFWVCWKKGKSAENGMGERLVRDTGLSLGLVDYKICSLNQVWSGLCFAAKKAKK